MHVYCPLFPLNRGNKGLQHPSKNNLHTYIIIYIYIEITHIYIGPLLIYLDLFSERVRSGLTLNVAAELNSGLSF